MLAGLSRNKGGLMAARAFLGLFEAAFGAGAPYFLSLFYQRRELGKRVALLTGMSPLANCFASSLAYGILHIRASIAGWRLFFLIGSCSLLVLAKSLMVNSFTLRGRSNRSMCGACLLPASGLS
jgi:MFS family permease